MNTVTELPLRDMVLRLGLQPNRIVKAISGGSSLGFNFELSPYDFLEQAEEDLSRGGNSARINALSNAKRAVHCQVDRLLAALGKALDGNFPTKMNLVADLGFIAPRIVHRVNRLRNVLEHDCAAPPIEEVEAAVDVASLFVGATDRHTSMFEGDWSLGHEDEVLDLYSFKRELSVGFMDDHFRVWAHRCLDESSDGDQTNQRRIGQCRVDQQDPLFDHLIRITVAGDRDSKVCLAVNRLFERF